MKVAASIAPAGAERSGNLFPRVPFGHPGLHSDRPYRDLRVSAQVSPPQGNAESRILQRATPTECWEGKNTRKYARAG